MREAAHSLPMKALGGPMTQAREPIEVMVWVFRPRHGFVQVPGRAVTWTPRAVRVEVTDEHARTEEVWVWANAVQRQDPHDRGASGP